MTQRPLVIVTRKLPESVEAIMKEKFFVEFNHDDVAFSKGKMIEAVQRADILVPTVTDFLNHDILGQSGPRLKLIANYGAGVNHIDLSACRDQGVIVANTPDVLTEDTADIALALIMGVLRRIGESERFIRNGSWQGWKPTGVAGVALRGKNLAIIGAGRIGQAVATRARAFGMKVSYHNRNRLSLEIEQEYGLVWFEDLDQMLKEADVVSLHCPAAPSTFHILDQRRLSLLKPDAVIINTARGDLVDEDALIDLLEKKMLGGAGMDVFQNEPDMNPRFLSLENVMLLPHIGSATKEARENMGKRVIVNIEAFIEGRTPPDRISAGTI